MICFISIQQTNNGPCLLMYDLCELFCLQGCNSTQVSWIDRSNLETMVFNRTCVFQVLTYYFNTIFMLLQFIVTRDLPRFFKSWKLRSKFFHFQKQKLQFLYIRLIQSQEVLFVFKCVSCRLRDLCSCHSYFVLQQTKSLCSLLVNREIILINRLRRKSIIQICILESRCSLVDGLTYCFQWLAVCLRVLNVCIICCSWFIFEIILSQCIMYWQFLGYDFGLNVSWYLLLVEVQLC
eukprot:TRINITY_DN14606_c0_g1_i9.p1 TRINITY_DN14606_c0_g1~~TRINITY_DN14606_c0_g1_i9.p1  ORF type:complete len:236 (-),score=-25.75 TRINITY_DN14606_c0_g1_i9:170-877(-)